MAGRARRRAALGGGVTRNQLSIAIDAFAEYAQARRAEIDAALDRVLPRPPHCPSLVAEAMRYAIESGGKRLRPILTLAAAEAVAGAADDRAEPAQRARQLALPAACAIEMIHTYSLVHDDLPSMDNDCLRRGRPTLHVVYGEGLAILAGDGLLGEAFALLAHEPVDAQHPVLAARKLEVLKRVGQAVGAGGMLGGQAMDLEYTGWATSPNRPRLDPRAVEDMYARKTGALIRAAATAGAIMAGGTAAQIAAVDRYAAEIGLAFQVVDDILDVQGATHELGKTAGKDEAGGKPTYPALHGLERSKEMARAAATLVEAGLPDDRLMAIAHWVVDRRC
jgi:geranylgeranyl diphosphate synthase type II